MSTSELLTAMISLIHKNFIVADILNLASVIRIARDTAIVLDDIPTLNLTQIVPNRLLWTSAW